VATLGNFATKLLSGKPTGITRVHGAEQEVTLGESRVLLYPLYHPAAALYTPAMLKVLEQDFDFVTRLEIRMVLELFEGNAAFRFEADVEDDHVVADLEHLALDDLALFDRSERAVVELHHLVIRFGLVLVLVVELWAAVGKRSELSALRAQLQQLRKGTSGEMLTQRQFPAVGLEYIRKERDVQYHQTLYDLLARQLEAARIDEAKASPNIQMVDPPLVPRGTSWPKPFLFILVGLVLGTMFGCIRCAVIYVYEYLETSPDLRERYKQVKRAMHLRG